MLAIAEECEAKPDVRAGVPGYQLLVRYEAAIAASYISLSGVKLALRTLSYRITLRKEPESGYTVLVPALPGCVTYGKTVEEAIEMAKDAIRGYVESLIEDGEEIPLEEAY